MRAQRRGEELPLSIPSGYMTWSDYFLWKEMREFFSCNQVAGIAMQHRVLVDRSGNLHTERLDTSEADEKKRGSSIRHLRALLGRPLARNVFGHPDGFRLQTQVEGLSQVRICAVSTRATHTLALSVDGHAYSFGVGRDHVLGHGDCNDVFTPRRIEALQGVRAVACSAGGSHSLVLDAAGAAFSWGFGGAGVGYYVERWQPTPRRIDALRAHRVVLISAGATHSLFVTAAGEVHSCGFGAFGMLGLGDDANRILPERVPYLEGVNVVAASAGVVHSALVDSSGRAWTFGKRAACPGEVVSCSRALYWTALPHPVRELASECVVSCAAGDEYTLFATAEGHAYRCGFGNLAPGYGTVHHDTSIINDVTDEAVIQVAASVDGYNLVLTASGRTCSWIDHGCVVQRWAGEPAADVRRAASRWAGPAGLDAGRVRAGSEHAS